MNGQDTGYGTMPTTVEENNTDVSRYLMAAAEERMYRDRWLAGLRDKLHAYLQMLGNGDPRMVHEVIDAIDEFLRRVKK